MRNVALLCTTLALAAAYAACGGAPTPPEAPAAPSAEPAAEPPPASSDEVAAVPAGSAAPAASAAPPAPKAWKELQGEERGKFMKEVVVPKMAALLQEHDAKKFAEVTCATCHGPGAKDGKFEMPAASLPKLDPKDGFAKHKKTAGGAAMTKFMMERVTPEMAGLLGMPVYDPATHAGFGCGGCHTMAK
ncbi:MAG: hypothetical protein IT376_10735 [Polyangiaceae bacterium]|nr:hypothetical protein [Polyangiaceae bacterium]